MKPYKLLLVLILLIIGCSAANRDWKKAQSLDSIDLYREFVDKYPSSTHLNEAESRIQELDWEKAKKKNTIQDYEEYIRNYPESSYCTIAKEKIENIAWNEVLDNETCKSYNYFLHKHPNGEHASEAKEWIKSFIKSSTPISGHDMAEIRNVINKRFEPFTFDDLRTIFISSQDELKRVSISRGSVSVFDLADSGIIVQIKVHKSEGEKLINVMLQILAPEGIFDVFHEKDGKSFKKLIRLRNPKISEANNPLFSLVSFSEAEISNFKDSGKERYIICNDKNCFDCDTTNQK